MSAQATAVTDTESIWREFHDELLGFINRRVPSREIAEDVLQDVMVRVHRNADAIERNEAVAAWIHAVTRNAIADHYRSAPVRREVTAEIDEDAVVSEPENDEQTAREELSRCMAPMLSRLETPYREAIAMTEVEGLTQAEAAARAGLSLSGMKSRVQRARRQLKLVLVQCCHIELDALGAPIEYRPRKGRCACGVDSVDTSRQ